MGKYFPKLIISLLLISLLAPLSVKGLEIKNPIHWDTIEKLIEAIVDFLIKLALAGAPIMIIIAGYYFVTSRGEPERISTAKKIVLYTSIGLIIILMAKGIVALVETIIKG